MGVLKELRTLREFVSKFPKTKDGVRVSPYIPVFHPDFTEGQSESNAELWVDLDTNEVISDYGDFGRPVEQCYSTYALAVLVRKGLKVDSYSAGGAYFVRHALWVAGLQARVAVLEGAIRAHRWASTEEGEEENLENVTLYKVLQGKEVKTS